jgi:transcriptional regulator GlxA family with amidase domain
MPRVAVLLLDGMFDTGVSTVLDTLDTANALAASAAAKNAPPPFRVTRVGVRSRVRTSLGFAVEVERARAQKRPDLVVVPALGAKTPETLEAALERRDVAEGAALLAEWARAGTEVAGACTASFVLGAAGLLDGRRATTTWWLAPLLRQKHPETEVDESRMVVESRGVITAGAALAHLDLAFFLVRRRSPSLARITARHMVFDERPSQGAFILPDHVAHTDEVVERFERYARKHLADFSVEEAARAAGASERTLERRLSQVLGKSPLSYVRDLRVEQAVHLLATTDGSIESIAERVGYRDGVTLRTLLREKTGRGVRELRASARRA